MVEQLVDAILRVCPGLTVRWVQRERLLGPLPLAVELGHELLERVGQVARWRRIVLLHRRVVLLHRGVVVEFGQIVHRRLAAAHRADRPAHHVAEVLIRIEILERGLQVRAEADLLRLAHRHDDELQVGHRRTLGRHEQRTHPQDRVFDRQQQEFTEFHLRAGLVEKGDTGGDLLGLRDTRRHQHRTGRLGVGDFVGDETRRSVGLGLAHHEGLELLAIVVGIERHEGPQRHERRLLLARQRHQRVVGRNSLLAAGEHGQGLVRGEFSEYLFGADLMGAFREVKQAFDPEGMMNPGKIIDTVPMDTAEILRYSPDYETIPLNTRYDWSLDNGFDGAIEMCNGAGVCRKEGIGTMCPSFQATLDEAHSTRGRANALRAAMSGKLPQDIGNPAVKEVLDLCLSCKACASECPSAVDVAKMKSEFLAAYHDRHGIPMTTKLFGNIHRVNQLAGRFPGLSNFMLENSFGQWGANAMGIPTDRPLPKYADKRFTATDRYSVHEQPDAVLIVDTFTEWNHPEVGVAVMRLAEILGLKINIQRLPDQGCCGRPAISKGLLDNAKKMANANVLELYRQYEGVPYLFIEPSCMSAFTDDYLTLVDPAHQPSAYAVAERCLSVEQFFADKIAEQSDTLNWKYEAREILLHGHCHQKALWGTVETLKLLKNIPLANVTEMNTGCCGVAGSFGYEHYDVSMKIAEDRLLPTIRANPSAIITAPGTSCRSQIHDAGFSVQHPIEVVLNALL